MKRETYANIAVLLAFLAIPLFGVIADQPFYVTLATRMAILATAAVGLNIILGLGGLVSLGHAAFWGIGGYVAGILAHHAFESTTLLFGLPGTNQMPVIWLIAIVIGALVALLIGAISLRTSGVYLIMITLAFAQMIYYFCNSWPAYGGEDGLSIYVRNSFFSLDTSKGTVFFAICLAVLGLSLLLFTLLRGSRFGSALIAVKQNEARVEAVGIAPYRIKLVAFVMSGAVTAWAGALFADLNSFVSPSMLSWALSGDLIILIVLGGIGRTFGPLAGR